MKRELELFQPGVGTGVQKVFPEKMPFKPGNERSRTSPGEEVGER